MAYALRVIIDIFTKSGIIWIPLTSTGTHSMSQFCSVDLNQPLHVCGHFTKMAKKHFGAKNLAVWEMADGSCRIPFYDFVQLASQVQDTDVADLLVSGTAIFEGTFPGRST